MPRRPLAASAAILLLSVGSAATPPDTTRSAFPLRVEAGTRYLVDAQGAPFLIHGDTAWSLIAQLTRRDIDTYLEDRARRGFNAILVNLLEHHFAARAPANAQGDAPFLTAGDFATPNPAYFAHAEYAIARAAEKGMLVMLTPAYMGFGGGTQGWYGDMVANGAGKLRAYGRYVANRFIRHDNILWVHGGDYNPPDRALLRAVADGIRDVDRRWLHTFHGSRGTAAMEFTGGAEPWLQVNNIYTTQSTVVAEARQEYDRGAMPFFLIEAKYEGEGITGSGVRQQAYQAVLSGASGQFSGERDVWRFSPGWRNALGREGARTMTHLRILLEGRRWPELRPDFDSTFVTGGVDVGSGRTAAAATTDRSDGLVYLPSIRTITVDLGRLAGPRIAARWYDPANGSYLAVPGSPFAAARTRAFTPMGTNAGGAGDWVLVLESVP